MTTDSPSTWPTIRLLRQPRAFSVPNSGIRRATAASVSRHATANAAISTSIASHGPSAPASLATLATDPVISLARCAELVTAAVRQQPVDFLLHRRDVSVAGRGHVDGVDLARMAGRSPGSVASAWARASGMYTSGGLLACGWVTMPMTVNLVLASVTVEPTFSLFAVA